MQAGAAAADFCIGVKLVDQPLLVGVDNAIRLTEAFIQVDRGETVARGHDEM